MNIQFEIQSKDGAYLFAQEWKPKKESKAAIALIHGQGEHSSRYTHVGDFFTGKGIGLVTFDQRGHGRTKGKRGHLQSEDLMWADIDCILEETKKRYPQKPLFLYGYSLGGLYTLSYILKRSPKVNGAICSAPLIDTYEPVPSLKITIAKLMGSIYPSFILNNGLKADDLSKDVNVVNEYINDPLVHHYISAKLGLVVLENGRFLKESTKDFPLPLLLMVGSDERIVSKTAIMDYVKGKKNITSKVWNGLFHELHNEPEKNEVLHFILSWMNQ